MSHRKLSTGKQQQHKQMQKLLKQNRSILRKIESGAIVNRAQNLSCARFQRQKKKSSKKSSYLWFFFISALLVTIVMLIYHFTQKEKEEKKKKN